MQVAEGVHYFWQDIMICWDGKVFAIHQMYEALIWQSTHLFEFHHATVPQINICLVVVGSLIVALKSHNEGQNRQYRTHSKTKFDK